MVIYIRGRKTGWLFNTCGKKCHKKGRKIKCKNGNTFKSSGVYQKCVFKYTKHQFIFYLYTSKKYLFYKKISNEIYKITF